MRSRTYEKDGQTRYVTEIECEVMQLLDKRPDNAAPQPMAQTVPALNQVLSNMQQKMPAVNEELPF